MRSPSFLILSVALGLSLCILPQETRGQVDQKFTFEHLPSGSHLRNIKPWYLDRGEDDAYSGFTVGEAPDGNGALALTQPSRVGRLGLSLRPIVATEGDLNAIALTFLVSTKAEAPLLLSFSADRGRTHIVSLRVMPDGEMLFSTERSSRSPAILPFLWVPGSWNKLVLAVFPEAGQIRIRLLNENDEIQGEQLAPLIREASDETLPWWSIHLSLGTPTNVPWYIRSVAFEAAQLNE